MIWWQYILKIYFYFIFNNTIFKISYLIFWVWNNLFDPYFIRGSLKNNLLFFYFCNIIVYTSWPLIKLSKLFITFRKDRDGGASFISSSWITKFIKRGESFVNRKWNKTTLWLSSRNEWESYKTWSLFSGVQKHIIYSISTQLIYSNILSNILKHN